MRRNLSANAVALKDADASSPEGLKAESRDYRTKLRNVLNIIKISKIWREQVHSESEHSTPARRNDDASAEP